MNDKRKIITDIIEALILFIVALSVLLLMFYYPSFENKLFVSIVIIGLPLITAGFFYYRYRKSHYKQIYTKDELRNQNR